MFHYRKNRATCCVRGRHEKCICSLSIGECSDQISRKIIKSTYPQPVILELTASAAFGKQNSKQNLILSNSTFYNLSSDI